MAEDDIQPVYHLDVTSETSTAMQLWNIVTDLVGCYLCVLSLMSICVNACLFTDVFV